MSTFKKFASVAMIGSMSLGVGGIGLTGASAATRPHASSVNVTVPCSQGSLGNLQVQREDNGQLSIDVGVDMARHSAGVAWKVKVTDNGTVVANSIVRTVSDGSFSVTRLLSPKAGANHVVFTATNLKSHETCSIQGTV